MCMVQRWKSPAGNTEKGNRNKRTEDEKIIALGQQRARTSAGENDFAPIVAGTHTYGLFLFYDRRTGTTAQL